MLRHWLNITTRDGCTLNGSWQATRKKYLEFMGRKCRCCGYEKNIEVHHILPRHVRPDLTLEINNLIALCKHCHFHVGHLNNYHNYNETIETVAEYVKNYSVLRTKENE